MIFNKNYSIQTKLMVFFNSMAVLLFVVVGLLFYRSIDSAINTSKRNELATLSYETSNKIDRFMFERYGDIQVMADSPLLGDNSIINGLKYDYLESVRKAYKTYDYIFITDETGSIEVQSGDVSGDFAYRNWITDVLHGKTLVSDFTFDKKKSTYVVYFASPIVRQGKVKGAVVERMNFDSISDIVRSVKPGRSGYAYLYKENGEAVFQPDGYKPRPGLELKEAGSSIITMEHDNIKYISAGHPVKKYETQKSSWFLMVEEPYSEAFSVSSNLRNYILVIVLLSVIALSILGVFMSKIITTPIRRLVSETQRIALGNIGQNIKVESKDEIGSLAISINSLLENLKSMMQQVLDISGEAASLEEIRQYSDSFFENLPSGIIIADRSGEITSINRTAMEILQTNGYTDLQQQDINRVNTMSILGNSSNLKDFSETGLKDLFAILLDGIEKQIMYKKHIVKIFSSDEEIPILINTTIQKDSMDNIIGVIAAFKRVDEIKQFEASVIRAKNLASLGQLSAGMAHEIRNPLTSVKGYAQYIKSELADEELIEDIDIIINEVDRLNGILDRFLAFARPRELKLLTANVNNLLKDIVRLVKRDLKTGISVAESYEVIPEIELDSDQMEQAILNLIINSIQAMPDGGKLEIKTHYESINGFVEIIISDTGYGIPLEDFEKIFEPFYTTKESGTGLGLAIASRIIEAHDGFLEVSSRQGAGTEFTVKLPEKRG